MVEEGPADGLAVPVVPVVRQSLVPEPLGREAPEAAPLSLPVVREGRAIRLAMAPPELLPREAREAPVQPRAVVAAAEATSVVAVVALTAFRRGSMAVAVAEVPPMPASQTPRPSRTRRGFARAMVK